MKTNKQLRLYYCDHRIANSKGKLYEQIVNSYKRSSIPNDVEHAYMKANIDFQKTRYIILNKKAKYVVDLEVYDGHMLQAVLDASVIYENINNIHKFMSKKEPYGCVTISKIGKNGFTKVIAHAIKRDYEVK